MKANRLSKDDSGADSSDAIIILALVLGVLLVLVYIGHSLGGWSGGVGTTVSDWAGDVVEGAQDQVEGAQNRISDWWNSVLGRMEYSRDVENEPLDQMWKNDYFYITSNESVKNYKAIISSYIDDTGRRYALTTNTSASAVEEIFHRRNAPTIVMPDDILQKMESLSIGEILTLNGRDYTAEIISNGDVRSGAEYTLTLTKA